MSFIMTGEWLKKYYGSRGQQVQQTIAWLQRHGANVPQQKVALWAQYKHLSEYQPNLNDIVDVALDRVNTEFKSELDCHRWVNMLRFKAHAEPYMEALKLVKPRTILELGVGGDSAISTAIFLAHIEEMGGGAMYSIDANPLGTTWERYKDVPFWTFEQITSEKALQKCLREGRKFDMIFLDTMPTYGVTKMEMEYGRQMTNNMLLDDASRLGEEHDNEGGKIKAKEEFLEAHKDWEIVEYPPWNFTSRGYEVGDVALVRKKPKKLIRRSK